MIYSYKNIQTEHSDERTAWRGFVRAIQDAIDNGFLNETSVWVIIRKMRNQRLERSDWTQITDVPFTSIERQAWQDHRQTLRDIPQIYTRPIDVEWPSEPPSGPRDNQLI